MTMVSEAYKLSGYRWEKVIWCSKRSALWLRAKCNGKLAGKTQSSLRKLCIATKGNDNQDSPYHLAREYGTTDATLDTAI